MFCRVVLSKINSIWSTRPGFGLGQVTPMPGRPAAFVASGTMRLIH
jgi:hypothetical protein